MLNYDVTIKYWKEINATMKQWRWSKHNTKEYWLNTSLKQVNDKYLLLTLCKWLTRSENKILNLLYGLVQTLIISIALQYDLMEKMIYTRQKTWCESTNIQVSFEKLILKLKESEHQ